MRTLLLFLAGAAAVTAQKAPAPPPPTTPAPPPTSITSPVQLDSLNFDVALAVSGRILMEDRQPPPEPVLATFECHGASPGTLTDSKGGFSIKLGVQQATRGNLLPASLNIDGCRVRIRMQGFEDIVATLDQPRSLRDLHLGDLTLQPAGPHAIAGFSVTGRNAPSKARSNYVRALDTINAGKYSEALALLDKAIAAYPKYASAIQLKGVVLERVGQREAARAAYQQAVTPDPDYAKPLVQLADMAAEDQNPTEAARWAAMVNRLVPGAYPDMYLIEGGAYCDLNRYDEAEKAAREGIAADPRGAYPGLRRLMGEVSFQKRGYAAALELFEWYLKEAPEAADIVGVQERVQTCKRLVKTAKK